MTTKSTGRPAAALATADGIEKLKAAVGKYWRIMGRSQVDGTFTFAEYSVLHLRITRSLVKVFNLAEAEELARLDWQSDLETAGLEGGREEIDFEGFYNAMVELADVWSAHTTPEKLAMFLDALFRRITFRSAVHTVKIANRLHTEHSDLELVELGQVETFCDVDGRVVIEGVELDPEMAEPEGKDEDEGQGDRQTMEKLGSLMTGGDEAWSEPSAPQLPAVGTPAAPTKVGKSAEGSTSSSLCNESKTGRQQTGLRSTKAPFPPRTPRRRLHHALSARLSELSQPRGLPVGVGASRWVRPSLDVDDQDDPGYAEALAVFTPTDQFDGPELPRPELHEASGAQNLHGRLVTYYGSPISPRNRSRGRAASDYDYSSLLPFRGAGAQASGRSATTDL